MLSALIHSDDVIFFYSILARLVGLFLLSPLFSRSLFPIGVRILLTVFLSVIFFMVLYPGYRNGDSLYNSMVLPQDKGWFYLILNMLKELVVGYILGFCFSLIIETILLAGELIDSMVGITASSSLDSISQNAQAFLSPLLIVAIALIALSMDLHHFLIKVIHDSFFDIPLGDYHFSTRFMPQIVTGSGFIFLYALKFVLVAFVLLTFISFTMGFIMRILPEFNPLFNFVPLRIFFSYVALILTLGTITPILHHSLVEVENLSKVLIQLTKKIDE